MAKRNSSNQDFTPNADGWDLSAGTTGRKLTVTGADITLTGSGTAVHTFPATTSTLARTDAGQTFTGTQIFSSTITGSISGNAGTVTNATLTTALTVNTGTLTLTANAANTSVLTIGAGAVSVSGANTGDQTSIVGITGTKAQFNTAVSDGDIVFLDSIDTITGVKTMSGLNVIQHSTSGLTIRNPANTFNYTITSAAIAADRVLNLPLITATDTLASLGLAQTWTATQTFTTPVLGTPTSGTLTNCTGLPIAGLVASTSTALGVGSIELGHASDTTLSRSSAGVLAVEGVVIPSISSTNTLTNKKITKRTGTATSSATPTIDTQVVDFYSLTAQAVDITSMTTNLTSTGATEGQTLWIAITGTAARAITWGASFEASTVALPTTTVSTNRLDVGFIWNTVTSKWRCVATS